MAEYIDSGDWKELVDILEVVYSLGILQGKAPWEIEIERIRKAQTYGSFSERIMLL